MKTELIERYHRAYKVSTIIEHVGWLFLYAAAIEPLLVWFLPSLIELYNSYGNGSLYFANFGIAVEIGIGLGMTGLLLLALSHFLAAFIDRTVFTCPMFSEEDRVAAMNPTLPQGASGELGGTNQPAPTAKKDERWWL